MEWLAFDVVQPTLGASFDVFTPDVDVIGNIMHHVIRSADRAEIVVADTTGNNPNVLYEIAVLDAMGQPCVPVKLVDPGEDVDDDKEEELKKNEPPKMAFDRAQYRFFKLTKGDTANARKKLKSVLDKALESRENGDTPENPLTDFFGFPLSSLSSAHGLARGYYNNYIVYALSGEIIEGPDTVLGKRNLPLECVIPSRVAHGTRETVKWLETKQRIVPVVLQAPGRKVGTYLWSRAISEDPILVDVPTALGQLFNNIVSRLGRSANVDKNSEDFRELEQDEIEQFTRYAERFQSEEKGRDQFLVQENLTIVRVENSREPELFKGLRSA